MVTGCNWMQDGKRRVLQELTHANRQVLAGDGYKLVRLHRGTGIARGRGTAAPMHHHGRAPAIAPWRTLRWKRRKVEEGTRRRVVESTVFLHLGGGADHAGG